MSKAHNELFKKMNWGKGIELWHEDGPKKPLLNAGEFLMSGGGYGSMAECSLCHEACQSRSIPYVQGEAEIFTKRKRNVGILRFKFCRSCLRTLSEYADDIAEKK